MRTLVTLVKREMVDHLAYFVGAVILSGLLTFGVVSVILATGAGDMMIVGIGGSIPVTIIVTVGVSALGVAQMYTDRTRKVSAFLTALPTTRRQIFTARVLAGLAAILIFIVPLGVAGAILIDMHTDQVPLYAGVLGDIMRSLFLTCFACYCLGLYAGWNRRSLAPTLGVLPVALLIPLLVIIKGLGPDVALMLSIFIVACLTATWCRFSSSSL
ncbi:MAG: hypothetical protein JSW27_19520 [Phycisphaerales bacterium]|nr:MAG: hypothetical protein JSW27_19520 [Phycisphaerales bacterium]